MSDPGGRRGAACLAGVAAACALAPAAFAQDVRWSVQTEVSGGYEKNPFNGSVLRNDASEDGDGGSGSFYVRGRVSPRVNLLWTRDTLSLGGNIDYRRYVRRYPTNDSYTVNTRFTHRINSRDSFFVGASARDYRNNAGFFDNTIVDPDTEVVEPVDVLDDIGLIGRRVRRYSVDAGTTFSLSALTSIVISGGASSVRYGQVSADQFDRSYVSYNASASIMRQISTQTSIGVGGSAQRSNYKDGLRPDSNVYSLFATGNTNLSTTWSLSAQVGLSLVRQKMSSSLFPLTDGSQQGVTGNVQLCKKGEFDNLCLVAARNYQPTATLGTTAQTSAGARYSRRISEYGTISGSVNYQQNGRNAVRTLDQVLTGRKYLRSNVEYGHQLKERLFLSASVFHRKLLGNSQLLPDNYGAEVGLRYIFGDLQ